MTPHTPTVSVELVNERDQVLLGSGGCYPVRAETTVAVADPGRLRVHVPAAVVERLGLRTQAAARVEAGMGRTLPAKLARDCRMTVFGRSDVFQVVVDSTADVCTLGAMALMTLDLVIHPETGLPAPRDPDQVVIDI